MRACPICHIENPIVTTILDREEYTKCVKCGLLYTHADVSISDFDTYYDGGREEGKNYQDGYIADAEEHRRNVNLAKEMQLLSGEAWTDKNILEVGSSAGYLLLSAQRLGAHVRGIEISKYASNYANEVLGISTVCMNWESFDLEAEKWNNYFDFLLMSHVIEHFVHPVEAIQKVAEALKPGGAWISQHPDASVYPGVKFHVRDHTPNEHLQIFDEHTILKISEPLDFKRVLYKQEEPGQSISVFRII